MCFDAFNSAEEKEEGHDGNHKPYANCDDDDDDDDADDNYDYDDNESTCMALG